jgi:subtilisin family serine protease
LISQAEHAADADCPVTDSHSARHRDGRIDRRGAQGNYQGEGIASGAPILPARALGKCGGYMSDVVEAALWAAGISLPGLPYNANPVRIINLSLGAAATCTPYYQDAFDRLRAAGVVVVAAGGNNGEDSTQVLPAAATACWRLQRATGMANSRPIPQAAATSPLLRPAVKSMPAS